MSNKKLQQTLKDALKQRLSETAHTKCTTELPEAKTQEGNQEDDIELYYAVNGVIKRTTLLTKDTESFLEWATFVHPILSTFPADLKTLAIDTKYRMQLYYVLHNGVSLFNTWFRNPAQGPVPPHTYNNKGH